MDFAKAYAMASTRQLSNDVSELSETVIHLCDAIDALRQKNADLELEKDQWRAHHASEKALRIEAMRQLDEVYGEDGNPLRAAAYGADEEFRVPSGDRKGEAPTKADHIYLTKFANVFNEHLARVHTHVRNWKEFLHEKISY